MVLEYLGIAITVMGKLDPNAFDGDSRIFVGFASLQTALAGLHPKVYNGRWQNRTDIHRGERYKGMSSL